jgi:hypothetical protein
MGHAALCLSLMEDERKAKAEGGTLNEETQFRVRARLEDPRSGVI